VAVWNACNLDVADASDLLTEFDAEIALDDLRVVEVELNAEVWRSNLHANRLRLDLPLEEIPRHIATIDRFDKNRDTLRSSLSSRPRYVLDIDCTVRGAKSSRLTQSRHHVQTLVSEHSGVFQRAPNARLEFLFALWQ
jgi:hypothetical protein